MSVISEEKGPSLYGEAWDTYRQMVKEVAKEEPYIERLDEEALLIDVTV